MKRQYHRNKLLTRLITQHQSSCDSLRSSQVLVAAGDDEYSTLRSQGRVTSSFIHFTDPTFHWWQFLVIVFGAVAGALLLGAGVAFVMYKRKGDVGWCVKKEGRGGKGVGVLFVVRALF